MRYVTLLNELMSHQKQKENPEVIIILGEEQAEFVITKIDYESGIIAIHGE